MTVAGATTLMPGMWAYQTFEAVRMLRGKLPSTPRRHADDQRHADLAPRHVPQRRRVVDDLVERQQAEIDGHDLRRSAAFRPAPRRCPAPTNVAFGEGRVANPLGPEFFEEAFAAGVRTAVSPHVLAHQKHTRIVRQGLAQPGRTASR